MPAQTEHRKIYKRCETYVNVSAAIRSRGVPHRHQSRAIGIAFVIFTLGIGLGKSSINLILSEHVHIVPVQSMLMLLVAKEQRVIAITGMDNMTEQEEQRQFQERHAVGWLVRREVSTTN